MLEKTCAVVCIHNRALHLVIKTPEYYKKRPVLVKVEKALLEQQHARHEQVVEGIILRHYVARD